VCSVYKNHESLLFQKMITEVWNMLTGDHVIAVSADFQACIEDGTVSQIIR